MFIKVNKTLNKCSLKKDEYNHLLNNAITVTYKRARKELEGSKKQRTYQVHKMH